MLGFVQSHQYIIQISLDNKDFINYPIFIEMLLKFVSFALCLSFSLGFVQEIMLYTEPDAGGSGLIFRTKEADLTQHQFILRDVKSFCSRG